MSMSDFLFRSGLMPNQGYHTPNSEVDLYSEKRLSFPCGCGREHPVIDCMAVIDFPSENKAVYICPNDNLIFNLVQAIGIFRVKGLKNISFYKSADSSEQVEIGGNLESRKRRG